MRSAFPSGIAPNKGLQSFRDTEKSGNALQRRASYQTHKGRCSTLICCMFLSFNRIRLKETCSRVAVAL
ncbi:hypothetical protein BMJ32_21055 [Sinorhizobium medicae]|nr:hypothetical protein BMJ32_21055 [Sinorhizobium medicae]